MRVAIATYGKMISPRFDCASTILFFEWKDQQATDHLEQTIQSVPGCQRVDYLVREQVAELLCGGIRRCDYYGLNAAGVKVIAGLMGLVEDVLAEYFAGRLTQTPPWEMPQGRGMCMGGSLSEDGSGRGPGRGPGRGSGQGNGTGQGSERGQGRIFMTRDRFPNKKEK